MRDWKQFTLTQLKALRIRPKKQMGQNFLIRYRVARQIVQAAKVLPKDNILEIGGGLGILTQALIDAGANVTVIEKDARLADFLEETYENNPQVKIIYGDALRVPWPDKAKVVANLPYSISSKILDRIMHENVPGATVMLQREVALRCLASAGSENYSRLSVLCNIHSHVKRSMDIAPTSFYPVPDISSVVINIEKKPHALVNDHADLELLTRNLFSLRRRLVRSVVRGYLKRKNVSEDAWERCPYNQTRIHELSVEHIDEILTHLKSLNAWPLA